MSKLLFKTEFIAIYPTTLLIWPGEPLLEPQLWVWAGKKEDWVYCFVVCINAAEASQVALGGFWAQISFSNLVSKAHIHSSNLHRSTEERTQMLMSHQ